MSATLNTFTANTVIESNKVNQNFQNLSDKIRPTFIFTITDSLTTGTNLTPVLICTNALTFEKVYGVVKNAPVGASIIIDINKNGTSIWAANQANRLTIGAGSTTGSTAAFDTSSIADGDQLTLDVDQVGVSVTGSDLTVAIKTS